MQGTGISTNVIWLISKALLNTDDEFPEVYNDERPPMSLDWDRLETVNQAFERLLATADNAASVAMVDGGDDATK